MIKGNYGSNAGCQLNRWPTCGSVFDEDRSLFSWTRRPHPLRFPPRWAPAHSHRLHCPHWLGDTSKVKERAAWSCHSPMNKERSLFWFCWPWQEISDVHTGWNLLLQKYYLLGHLFEKYQNTGKMSKWYFVTSNNFLSVMSVLKLGFEKSLYIRDEFWDISQ